MKVKLIKEDDGYSLHVQKKESTNREFIASTNGMYVKHKLSKQNCDEIFGVVDVHKLAGELYSGHVMAVDWQLEKSGFIKGFNKAMELNKDKVFTVTNLRVGMIQLLYLEKEKDELSEVFKERQFSFIDDYIQSLQPKEIEVEIEMELVVVGQCHCPCHKGLEIIHVMACCNPKHFEQPKLDSSGCLILTKKNIKI
jgi:hypothetical protein